MDQFQKALECQMRQLSCEYDFSDRLDSTALQLHYGKYVCSETIEGLIKKYQLFAPDAAELRIRNAEAALGAKLIDSIVPLEKTLSKKKLRSLPMTVDPPVLERLNQVNPVASIRHLVKTNRPQVVDIARELGVSRGSMSSFLMGVPLRRNTFAQLCSLLKASSDDRLMFYLRFLWAQMYCQGKLLDCLDPHSGTYCSDPARQGHLFSLESYWNENVECLEKMSVIRSQ